METVKQFLTPLLDAMGKYLPSAFGALLVFLVGLGLAKLVRKGIKKLLRKLNVDQRLTEKIGKEVDLEKFLSNLFYYVVMLWVMLLTLDVLGVEGVLDPVVNMFNKFLDIFPNVIASLLIGFAGYLIAKIVSSAVEVLSRGLDTLSTKIGLSEEFSFSRLIGQVVFIVIFIPVLISALDALQIAVISVPSTEMLSALLGAIPKILAAALIIGIAYIVGRFITTVVRELMQNLGSDQLPEKLGFQVVMGEKSSFSGLVGGILFFFIMLAATVSAVEQLAMPQLSRLLSTFLVFASEILLGLIILAMGNYIASLAHKALSQSTENKGLASVAKIAILALFLAMGLRAMGIADDIVNLAFGLTLGAVAVSVALSFGLGGREAAGTQMEYWLKKLRKEE